MNKTTVRISLLASIFAATAIVGCDSPAVPVQQPEKSETKGISLSQPVPPAAAAENRKAPAAYVKSETYFSLPLYSGGKIGLESLAGKPVFVMFFANYCPYCRKAAPFVEKIHENYKKAGLEVVGISVDEDPGKAAAFVKQFALTFPVAIEGREVSARYGAHGVPYLYLLDKQHKLINLWAGYDRSFDAEIIKLVETAIK